VKRTAAAAKPIAAQGQIIDWRSDIVFPFFPIETPVIIQANGSVSKRLDHLTVLSARKNLPQNLALDDSSHTTKGWSPLIRHNTPLPRQAFEDNLWASWTWKAW
jgi:hypothetical protein